MSRKETRSGTEWNKHLMIAGGEVVLIIVGVLGALAVDEWRADRADRALEHEYLGRLIDDMQANLQVAQSSARWQAAIARNARLVFPLVSRGVRSEYDDASIVAQAYHATPGPTPSWVDDTFSELLGTGSLVLIGNQELRKQLLSYYRFLEAADYPFELRSHAYREAIRETFDPDLQLEIRRQCDRYESTCALATSADLAALVDWMSGNGELSRYLTRVITQSTRAETEYLAGVTVATERILALLTEELGEPEQ